MHHSCDLISFFARHGITCARSTSLFGRNITTCSARYNFTVSEFLAGTVDINAVVRQYCRNTETKDQARKYQFMRDLIVCRYWYDRDSGCILSRDEICDIINFFGCQLMHVSFYCMFPFIFECVVYFLFITLYYVYDLIINYKKYPLYFTCVCILPCEVMSQNSDKNSVIISL